MKKIFVLLLMVLFTKATFSDVIFPVYSADKFCAGISIEKIFSFEKKFGNSFSFLPWAGAGVFWPFYSQRFSGPLEPAFEIEAALESRWYPLYNNVSGLFLGIYAGGALIIPSYAAIGSSIGFKTGYKHVIKKRDVFKFSFEPYASVSTLPVVHSTYYRSDEILHFPGVILTIGFRLVSEWGR